MTRNACAFGHDLGLLFILTYPVADESREEQKIPSLGMEKMGPRGEKATDNLLSVGIMRVAE